MLNLQTVIVCLPPPNPTFIYSLLLPFRTLAFRTDADISHKKGAARERDLQAWVASGDTITPTDGLVGDDDTFGPGANGNTSWDQFSANETLFGVKASFDEDVYTTKLDRSAPDFKERERKAQRIANEIIGVSYVGV
jgi:PAB1-binding protein PBP1